MKGLKMYYFHVIPQQKCTYMYMYVCTDVICILLMFDNEYIVLNIILL